jgi:methyl coenzyme M reductase alpha subunit
VYTVRGNANVYQRLMNETHKPAFSGDPYVKFFTINSTLRDSYKRTEPNHCFHLEMTYEKAIPKAQLETMVQHHEAVVQHLRMKPSSAIYPRLAYNWTEVCTTKKVQNYPKI